MKSSYKIAVLLIIIHLTACQDNNEKSNREIKTDMLTAASWGNAHVTHTPDGDLSNQYTHFAMSFTSSGLNGFDGTYIIFNGGHAFTENTGKWKFSDDLSQIILDSGKEMDIQLNEVNLQLDFIVAPIGGRVGGVSGHFVFDLRPF
jgi:hypothetical protein